MSKSKYSNGHSTPALQCQSHINYLSAKQRNSNLTVHNFAADPMNSFTQVSYLRMPDSMCGSVMCEAIPTAGVMSS